MNRKLLMFGIPLLCLAMVSAGIYYEMVSVNIHVVQPISISGELNQNIDCDAGDTCIGNAVTISNTADEDKSISLSTGGTDALFDDFQYVGKLTLTKKIPDIGNGGWVIDDGNQIEMTYTVVGNNFGYDESAVPEGYTLVYAKDHENRFDVPAEYITADEINSDLPQEDDWNVGDEADYCTSDIYEHCQGAKLWLVKTSDLLSDGEISWEHINDYYYETDLVYYFNNNNGEITIPANSKITFYPQVSVNKYDDSGDKIVSITIK